MTTSKIIKGVVGGGRYAVTAPIVKEDYGLYLKIEGLELPATYEVDFSNSENNGTSVTMIGNSDGVLIPHQFIDSGKDIFAFLYHVGVDFGRTVYKFRIPNKLRPDRTNEEPTPEEQSVIDQAISALNSAVEQTAQDVIDADASAQSAGQSAISADESAQSAQQSLTALTEYGDQAIRELTRIEDEVNASASRAEDSAQASAQSAQSASQSAQDAQDTLEEFTTPTASATTLPEGSSATASYADGHFTFGIPTGATGPQGPQGDDYVLTEQDKQDIAELVDVPVDDVQINGQSIVTDGVANVPVASNSVLGAVRSKVGDNGIQILSSGYLGTYVASDSDVKNGIHSYRPISPNREHSATFYGLAKAAGDTTQSSSSNAVGVYTDAAKVAIQKMLGIYEPPYELLNDFTLEEESGFDLTADMNGVPYDLRNVFIYVYFPANSASVSSGYARYRCYDANNRNTNAETGRYGTSTQAMFKYITLERKANLAISSFTIRENTGGAGTWRTKPFTIGAGSGVMFDLGNITRIACIDNEPAGTQIKIYGQRAY